MKLLRCLLLGLAAVAVVLIAAAAVALNPRFQIWAVRRALAARPGLHGSVGGVAVGLTEVDVTDLRFERAGTVLVLPSFQAELPLVYAGLRRELVIRRLVATGWTLDLSRAHLGGLAADFSKMGLVEGGRPAPPFSLLSSAYAEEAAAAAVPAFEGLFHRLRLPVDMQVDGLTLEGDVLLPPGPGYASARVHVVLSGGGFAAGHEGQLAFSLRSVPPAADPAPGAVTADGTLAGEMDTPRTFRRLVVRIDAAALGGKFPPGAKLAISLKAERDGGSESYGLALAGENKKLVTVQTDFSGDTHRLAGTWRLDLSDDDLAPFVLGRPLPAFDAVGEGRFDTDAAMDRLHCSGRIEATVDRLGVVRPELAVVGAVKLAAEFDLAHRDGELRVDRLSASLAGVRPIAEVRALQAFAFNVRTGALEVADPARDLVGIALEEVPVGWTQAFLSSVVLTGDGIQGKFVASAREGGLALRSSSPLEISGLTVMRAGQPWLSGVDVSATLSADYTPAGWQVEITPCTARRGGAPVLTLDARAGRLAGAGQPVKAAGRVHADLPALLLRASDGAAPVLARGEFDGEFTASVAARSAYQAKFRFSDLAVRPAANAEPAGEDLTGAAVPPPPWPTITAEMRADVDAGGKCTLLAPLLFESPDGKSDLTLAGTLAPGPAGIAFDGQATSALLTADDLKALGGLLAVRASASSAAAGSAFGAAAAPTAAFWPGASGRVTLALKQVRQGPIAWSDVRGQVLWQPGEFAVERLQATLGTGGEVSAVGRLRFGEGAAEEYAWSSDLTVSNFDYGAFSRVFYPDRPPLVEGKFKLTSRLHGGGASLADWADGTQGDFRLASKGGIFRALRADVADSLKQSPALISQALDSVGSLFGVKEDRTADAKQFLDKQGKIVVDLAERLREIPYDQIDVVARRGADRNIRCTEFALIAPEVRLSGTGQISYEKGLPLGGQPLVFDGQLDARGKIAAALGSIGLLSGKQDDLGYIRMSQPFRLGGTLDSIDDSQWQDTLIRAAVHKAAGGLLDKLLGK
jgi:hypothetical protein